MLHNDCKTAKDMYKHYDTRYDGGDLSEERLDMKDPYGDWIQMYCDEEEDASIATRKRRGAEEWRRLGPVGV